MTRIDAMIVANPNRDVIEDRKIKQGYSLKEIRTVMTRVKLLIFCYEWLKLIDRTVVYYDFPRYSIAWYIVSNTPTHSIPLVPHVFHILLRAIVHLDIRASRGAASRQLLQ